MEVAFGFVGFVCLVADWLVWLHCFVVVVAPGVRASRLLAGCTFVFAFTVIWLLLIVLGISFLVCSFVLVFFVIVTYWFTCMLACWLMRCFDGFVWCRFGGCCLLFWVCWVLICSFCFVIVVLICFRLLWFSRFVCFVLRA